MIVSFKSTLFSFGMIVYEIIKSAIYYLAAFR